MRSWSLWQWLSVVVVTLLAVSWLTGMQHQMSSMAWHSVTANSARQIVMALKIYSQEHGGLYPDGQHSNLTTANATFRHLFREEIFTEQEEPLFGSPRSPFKPDGKTGSAPDFAEALKPGENHWAYVGGLSRYTFGSHPLILENTALPDWPPRWKPDSAEEKVPGRTWKGNRIVVARNDGSAEAVKLRGDGDGLLRMPESLDAPPDAPSPTPRLLPVER